MRPIRRIDVTFTDDDIYVYNELAELAQQLNESLPDYIKTAFAILKRNKKQNLQAEKCGCSIGRMC
jgi:hypothetical protein